jgi:hypothetical protein
MGFDCTRWRLDARNINQLLGGGNALVQSDMGFFKQRAA